MIRSPELDEPGLLAMLGALGHRATGLPVVVRSTGRSHVSTLQTDRGTLWIKRGYDLPPGEGAVVHALLERWSHRLPETVYCSKHTVVMKPLPGRELTPEDPLADWTSAARALAEIAHIESAHAASWLQLGVRDRRPDAWEPAVKALRESPVLATLEDERLAEFDYLMPDFLDRYVAAFDLPPTLVPQDSGCCNIHISDNGPIFYDWADVVVGHPVFSCDRLLDQTPHAYRDAVIDAFCEPFGLSRSAFRAMRRSNVLHEMLRYHDELAYLAEDDPQHQTLAAAVRSQLKVLVTHEMRRQSTQNGSG